MNVNGVDLPEAAIADFYLRNHIRRLGLFGSILREDFGSETDVLERELSALIGRKVDLNTPGFLGRDFRDEVLALPRFHYQGARRPQAAESLPVGVVCGEARSSS